MYSTEKVSAWLMSHTHTLTIWTHSISGSRTAWFPTRDTTQAGVLAEASSNASTASTPIRLACKGHLKVNTKKRNICGLSKKHVIFLRLETFKDIVAYQDPVKGRGGPTSLHVAQDGDPGVKTKAAYNQLHKEGKWNRMTVRIKYIENVHNNVR